MISSDVRDTKISVIGAARSGVAVAGLLSGRGARVFLSDAGPGQAEARERLDAAGIDYEFDGHTDRVLDAAFVVISPGVPSSAEIVQRALGADLPVYSEIEVASWFCGSDIVAITGSNGKTTTTSLLAHVVRNSGKGVIAAGNIGSPFSEHVDHCTADTTIVLEVSSFQLDHIESFHPRISVLLNITPDHLDRYDNDFASYAESKFRIVRNQGPARPGGRSDVAVYNYDDQLVRERVQTTASRQGFSALAFSINQEVARGAYVRDDQIILRLAPDPTSSTATPMEEVLMPAQDLSLRGRHNLYNSLAAAIAARAMEISSDVIRESLASFEGVPHRLEYVRQVHGVKYVNDSKATNVNALWYALESFNESIVLLAGGRDKGNDYEPVKGLVRTRCRGVIGIGESGDKVVSELGDHAKSAARAHSLEEALQYAQLMAEPGDIVLLSPACASFDQFKSYEDRGDTFKRLVRQL
jgi:UDP-N-acetylmuramoylalanine--D-glutamate ligase